MFQVLFCSNSALKSYFSKIQLVSDGRADRMSDKLTGGRTDITPYKASKKKNFFVFLPLVELSCNIFPMESTICFLFDQKRSAAGKIADEHGKFPQTLHWFGIGR